MKHSQQNKSCPSLSEWLAVHLDVPADLCEGGLRLDLRGRNTLTVYGCQRIADFSPTRIRLSMKSCDLLVEGGRLSCTSYLSGTVGIEGCICRMAFLDDREET